VEIPADRPPGDETQPETLPLFPLSTALFPGGQLPLQVFEPRYRQLVADLLELPAEQRRFGVVAIQQGSEAGMPLPQMFPVGCEAQVRRIEPLPDGRSALLATGGTRFRLLSVDTTAHPYLTGRVRWMPEPPTDEEQASTAADAVRVALSTYLATLSALAGGALSAPEMPADPTELSYLAAGALMLPLRERQALLELPDTVTRLRTETGLLRRETLLMREMRAVSAPEFFRVVRALN
jgi:uncharacterized protein